MLRQEGKAVPTEGEMLPKVQALKSAREHQLTEAEVDYMLQERKKVCG